MGYRVMHHFKRKDGTIAWRLAFEKDGTGKRERRYVPRSEWQGIGFDPTWTIDEAKVLAKSINLSAERKRREEIRNNVNDRLAKEALIECEFLPKPLVKQFEATVLIKRLSDDDEDKFRTSKLSSHWRAVKRIIREIEISPSDWSDESQVIYNYFKKRKDSPAYVQKLLRLMNMYGYWFCKKRTLPFLAVEFPRGNQRQKIAESYFDKRTKGMTSEPISPSDLEMAKGKLKLEHYNWLYISIWFGLRPSEIDQLLTPSSYKVETEGSTKVLWVYQAKLSSIPKAERWKLIPILQPQQEIALSIIASSNFKRPLTKTIKLQVKDGATCYGGRKAFHKLMSDFGYGIELISAWMGHKSVERTWRSYRDNLKVALPKKAG